VRSSQNAPRRPTTDAAVSDLVESIRALRLTLTADLAAAAAAIEAGEPAIAQDILTADRLEVRRLSLPASPSLPARPARRARRRRVLFTLPAVPLIGALAMTGAVALTTHDPGRQQMTPHRAAAAARPLVATGTRGHHSVPTIERPLQKSAVSQPIKQSPATGHSSAEAKRQAASAPTPTATATPRPNAPPLIRIGQRLLDPWPVPTPTTQPLGAPTQLPGSLETP
jgi:hypothetical protein